jgi:hypothetical protein
MRDKAVLAAAEHRELGRYAFAMRQTDPPPLKWSSLMYGFRA